MANPTHGTPKQGNEMQRDQDQNRKPQEQFPSSGSGARRPDAGEERTQRPSQDSNRSSQQDEVDKSEAAGGLSSSSSSRTSSSSQDSKSSGSRADSSRKDKSSQR